MTMRITKNHSFSKKVDQLYKLMEELNISIEYGGCNVLNITDTENDKTYKLCDADSGEYLSYFPTGIEFKLTFEDDNY